MLWATRNGRLTTLLRRSCERKYGYVHVPKKRTPHLLGHGSEWRKCFVVHPHSQTSRALESYQWLTGSILQEGLPATLPGVKKEGVEVALFEERVREAVEQGAGIERLKGKRGVERVRHILSSALVALWMTGEQHLQSSTLTRSPRVESYWQCGGDNFLCITHPLFILHSAEPLDLFSDPEHFNPIPPDLGQHPRNLGLFEHSFDQITPFAGCHRFSPTPFTHTVFCCDLRARSQDQLLAHGLLQLFTQTAAESLQYGYLVDSDLAYPLATQGILSDGKQLTFLAFQLNTLQLNQERGRKNVMWVGPTLELLSEDGVNRECFELLTQLIMNSTVRERPALPGLRLHSHSH